MGFFGRYVDRTKVDDMVARLVADALAGKRGDGQTNENNTQSFRHIHGGWPHFRQRHRVNR